MELGDDSRSEAELLRRAAGGNLDAMETIYTSYRSMAFAVGVAICGNASDADDVVQETFLRAFRNLGQWRGEAGFASWLYAVALRTAQNWKSRFAGRRPVGASAEASLPGASPAERAEEHDRLMAAIGGLPEQQRLTLTLKRIRGLSIREVARLQGVAEGTVKANLHHAVSGLMKSLGREP